MYPVPPNQETYTTTEQYIGAWIQARGRRDDIVLASKIAGPTGQTISTAISAAATTIFPRAQIIEACHASLKRPHRLPQPLPIALAQRQTNFFGKLGMNEISANEHYTPFDEILDAMGELVRQGKSAPTAYPTKPRWGTLRHLNRPRSPPRLARIASVQNPYNLLNRSYEVGMAEISLRENVPLLA